MKISMSKLFTLMCIAILFVAAPSYATHSESETIDKNKIDKPACWFVCPPDIETD